VSPESGGLRGHRSPPVPLLHAPVAELLFRERAKAGQSGRVRRTMHAPGYSRGIPDRLLRCLCRPLHQRQREMMSLLLAADCVPSLASPERRNTSGMFGARHTDMQVATGATHLQSANTSLTALLCAAMRSSWQEYVHDSWRATYGAGRCGRSQVVANGGSVGAAPGPA